jgi:SAM-dependent methyltransferase
MTQDGIDKYQFYHCIEIAPGVVTPGFEQFKALQAPVLAELRHRDLRGKRVLDIGCRDGLFSFEAERLGAAVLGIDNDLSKAAVEFLIPALGSKVEMRQVNLYDFVTSPDDRFDLVVFAGVLYHLRFPFFGLKRIADALKDDGTLIIETGLLLSHHKLPFIFSPAPKDSPYDPTSVTFFNHKALVSGLESMGFREINCTSVIVQTGSNTAYAGWDAFLAGDHGHLAEAEDPIVGRATYVCRIDRSSSDRIAQYWYTAHNLHADPEAAARFLASFRE